MAELVDALDSKSSSARSAGSIPARGTKYPSKTVQNALKNLRNPWVFRPKASFGVRLLPLQWWHNRWYPLHTNIFDTNMALTEMEIRSARPGAKIVKRLDGGGLPLWVSPDGAKRWGRACRFW